MAEEGQAGRIRYIRTGELLASNAEYARTYCHYASDEMGSITHVVAGLGKEAALAGQGNGPVLDGQGNQSAERGEVPENSILNRYEYDAWGNLTVCEETVPNRFRFNGQQYYLRARYYNPVIGRFTQEDTYRGDGLNLYAYCRNNPVYYVDPSGHMTCKEARKTMREAIRKGWTLQDLDASVASQLKAWYDNKTNHGGLKSGENKLASQLGLDVEGGVETNLSRVSALALEQKITDKHVVRNGGFMPSSHHKRPTPKVSTIEQYVTYYNESPNNSTGGRY